MPRPRCCRRIRGKPTVSRFKPAGIPARRLEEIILSLDELEAVRLADLDGLYQEHAADLMRVSRPTFGRILGSAHRKIAEALVLGKSLNIQGGPVYEKPEGEFERCPPCQNRRWRKHQQAEPRTQSSDTKHGHFQT